MNSIRIDPSAKMGRWFEYEGEVIIGKNVVVGNGVKISGKIVVGNNCKIRHHIEITGDGYIGEGSEIGHDIHNPRIGRNCIIEGRVIDSIISEGCEIGEFAEIKRSFLAYGVTAKHSCGVRDAEVGYLTNISEYAQIANYDGARKHKTKIGSKCMIGVQARIMGGVEIGDECFIADGARVDDDIPPRTYFNPGRALKNPQFRARQDNCAWYLFENYLKLNRTIGPEDRAHFSKQLEKKFDQVEDIKAWLETPLEHMAGRTPIECLKSDGYRAVYEVFNEYLYEILWHRVIMKKQPSDWDTKKQFEARLKKMPHASQWLNTPLGTGVFYWATPLEVLEKFGWEMLPLIQEIMREIEKNLKMNLE